MDPISIAPLAISAWNLVFPYIKKIEDKLIENASESLPDIISKLWDLIKEKLEVQPESKSLPAELCKNPDDMNVQDAFKRQLEKLLENDKAFAHQLDMLVNEAKKTASTTVTFRGKVEGSGALAQGKGAKAVGAGGILIEGNATHSTIISGDKNIIKKKKRNER